MKKSFENELKCIFGFYKNFYSNHKIFKYEHEISKSYFFMIKVKDELLVFQEFKMFGKGFAFSF